jgi:hypothetical protein
MTLRHVIGWVSSRGVAQVLHAEFTLIKSLESFPHPQKRDCWRRKIGRKTNTCELGRGCLGDDTGAPAAAELSARAPGIAGCGALWRSRSTLECLTSLMRLIRADVESRSLSKSMKTNDCVFYGARSCQPLV